MAEIFCFPNDLQNRVRVLAAELCKRRKSVQRREISTAAGRLNEEIRNNGGERWQAVQCEDYFIRAAYARLHELEGTPRNNQCSVLPLAAAGGRS